MPGAQPAEDHTCDVDVTAIRLVGTSREPVRFEQRLYFLEFVRGSKSRVNAEPAPKFNISPARFDLLRHHDQHVAKSNIARVAKAHFGLPIVQNFKAADRHAYHQFVGIMLANLTEGAPGRAADRRALVNDDHFSIRIFSQLKGDTGAHDAGADDYNIRACQLLLTRHDVAPILPLCGSEHHCQRDHRCGGNGDYYVPSLI